MSSVLMSGFSQTGPGGIEDTSGGSNLVLWLDASTINQSNNTDLATWLDLSGYGNDAIGPSGNRPVYVQNALNGYPAIEFEESNTDYMSVADNASLKPNEISIIVVGEYSGSTNNWSPFVIKTSDWNWYDGYGLSNWEYSNLDDAGCYVNDYSSNFVQSAFPFNTPTILSMVYNKTDIRLYYDESLQGTDNHSTNISNSNKPLYLGITPDVPGTGLDAPLDGSMSEVIILDRGINDAERIIIHNYLSAKYGLSLGAYDLYIHDNPANGDYDHDVAGIGRISASNLHTSSRGSGIVQIDNPFNLDNDEFMFWGHDGVDDTSPELLDLPTYVLARMDRTWRVSEVNTSNAAVNVGALDITFDLTGKGSVDASDLVLLVDTDNDGNFIDETPISGAVSIGSNQYRFSSVTAISDQDRFTLGTTNALQTTLGLSPVYGDNDEDGINDLTDIDDDNDGIEDSLELGDSDGDGVDDRIDLDADNDGIYDVVEGGDAAFDSDGDGDIDSSDAGFGDSNTNGMSDNTESTIPIDSDGDGNIDAVELDSDNDACYDSREAGFTDSDEDGILGTSPESVNANGEVTSGSDGYTSPNSAYLYPTIAPCLEICNNGIDDNKDGRTDETYPGGIEQSLLLWVKADAGFTAGSWSDQSKHGNDGTNFNGPVSSTSINFNPAINFDGSNYTSFSLPELAFEDGNNHLTLFMVYYTDDNNSTHGVFGNSGASADNIMMDSGSISDGNGSSTSDPSFIGNEAKLLTLVIDEEDNVGGGANSSFARINGVTEVNFSYDETDAANVNSNFFLGRSGNHASSLFFDGQIMECIIYFRNDGSESVDADGIGKIESYLSLKYGINNINALVGSQ